MVLLALVALCVYSNMTSTSYAVRDLTEEMRLMDEINTILSDVQGDDFRIMRYDATKYTAKRQEGGGCGHDKMNKSFHIIMKDNFSNYLRARAAEYLTFCITDNRRIRAYFSQQDGIHAKLVSMASSIRAPTDPLHVTTSEIDSVSLMSAMACHLIYIASFNDENNHRKFLEAGAVEALAGIIKNENNTPLQIMWAAAALQNLAASYCSTSDGRCRWDWTEDNEELILTEDSTPMTIDGSPVRESMLEDTELIDKLVHLSCSGPTTTVPMPGEGATLHRDELSTNLFSWAATGALKNLAILLDARDYIVEEYPHSMACFCRLSHSRDWLETNKGEGILFMLRRSDPCWFHEAPIEYGKQGATPETELCIDRIFYDTEGYTCTDYDDERTESNCNVEDRNGVSAKEACCACGGGDKTSDSNSVDESFE